MALSRKEKEYQTRRNLILRAAEKLFAEKGYENASMNEIAQLSEFTKRTVYQYFQDKADLNYSVILELYQKLVKHLQKLERTSGNGYQQMEKGLQSYLDFYLKHQKLFRITYDIGKVRYNSQNEKLDEFLELDKQLTQIIAQSITLGQQDGSISNESDTPSTTVHFKFLVTACFNQFAVSLDSYSKHIGKNKEDFARTLIDTIMRTLKP